jgi:CheY-like chemotaxis protein
VRVLVVDDDEAIRETLRDVLDEEGYATIEAPDGLVALEILQALSYAIVVLSNHMMPRLDGPGFFAIVSRDPVLRSRHVYLYMTANTRVLSPSFADQLARLRVPVLRKPFDLGDLLAAIADAARRLPAATARQQARA